MPRTLFLLFNHEITEDQRADARSTLGIERIMPLPSELQKLWSNIPADLREIEPVLEPVRQWLASVAVLGDCVLIQGDFGACYLMVGYARDLGLTPVYSTNTREAVEERLPDGKVKLTHYFQHHLFREYGR